MRNRIVHTALAAVIACVFAPSHVSPHASAQIAIKGKTIHTMAGPPITDGVIVIRDGKIAAVGPANTTGIPEGFRVLEAAVVTPGLIDAHCTVGVSGIYNTNHDQDQLERSSAIQPELRAIDAYNPQEKLIEYVRGFGITTIHTGHAPGELISGQTLIAKTAGRTIDEAVIVREAMVAATLGPEAEKQDDKSPGTRGKMMAMLRGELLKAQEYLHQQSSAEEVKKPDRDLRKETLVRVLRGELPLLITVNRAQDISSALRLAEEFKIKLVLDSAAEAYLLVDEIKRANVLVIVHPSMQRAHSETENQSFETAATLRNVGIPIALQGGYESYVPKARVVLFEAAIAAANGLTFEHALGSITIDAARLLGVAERLGSLEVGKDGDVALFDGDPFEYLTHCTAVVINGQVVSQTPR